MKHALFLFFFLFVVSGWATAQPEDEGLGLAESLLRQNRVDDAEKLALRALQSDPESLEARLVLAKVHLTRGDLVQAREYADELLSRAPENPDHHALQGMVLMFADQNKEAEDSLRRALEIGQESASAEQMASYSNTLVLILYKRDARDEALKVCLQAIEDYPEDADLYLSCSRLYREAGDYGNALEVARRGLSVDPSFAGLYASAALAHAGLGQTELSEQAYRELLKRDPELAAALRATLDGKRADEAEYKIRTQ